jgi:proteasome lid subunit RPN8/RPN11
VSIRLPSELLRAIHAHGETAYPNEGCGLLLGRATGPDKQVTDLLPIRNGREPEAAHNRYLITPQDMLRGEQAAEERGLEVIGVFHSHPDHPARPSEFDREHALPWYSYIITSIDHGRAVSSRSWLLADDRSAFAEESIDTAQ